jgi:hypothetical protein
MFRVRAATRAILPVLCRDPNDDLVSHCVASPAHSLWLGRRQRLPPGDGAHAAPRLGVVGDQREMAAQLDHGGEFAPLLEGGTYGGGGRLVDDEHAVSMGSPGTTGKRAGGACLPRSTRVTIAAGLAWVGSGHPTTTAQARRPLASTQKAPPWRANSWTRSCGGWRRPTRGRGHRRAAGIVAPRSCLVTWLSITRLRVTPGSAAFRE